MGTMGPMCLYSPTHFWPHTINEQSNQNHPNTHYLTNDLLFFVPFIQLIQALEHNIPCTIDDCLNDGVNIYRGF